MKNFRLFALTTLFAASTLVASEAAEVVAPVVVEVEVVAPAAEVTKEETPAAKVEAPAAKEETPAADAAKVEATVAPRTWVAFGKDMMTGAKDTALYVPKKANAACNSLNAKMFALNAENKTYAEMFKSNAIQLTVGSVVAVVVAYAAYQYANKPATKKAKN